MIEFHCDKNILFNKNLPFAYALNEKLVNVSFVKCIKFFKFDTLLKLFFSNFYCK